MSADENALSQPTVDAPWQFVAKRGLDVSVAAVALMLLLPLLMVIAILIARADRGPVLFKQKRVGRDGKLFYCLKFRSMVLDAEAALAQHLSANAQARREWQETQKLVADPRITPLGRFLRRTSLDELPQLWNVLLGDMSLVGPRPIIQAEMARYGSDLVHYLAVRPGLTGLWQVSGRSTCSYSERVALDVRYVCEWSFWKDVKIIVRTVPEVLKQRGSV